MFGYFDWSFVVIIPAMIFALYAQWKVNSAYKKYSKINNRKGLTARDAAREILDSNGLYDVRIEHISGDLTDHYDPTENVIRLSDSVDGSTSVAAIGVAAHEVGHAIQHANDYSFVRFRTALVPITNLGSKVAMILIFIGIAICSVAQLVEFGSTIAIIGLIAYSFVALFQLVTLPVEFDASNRAMDALQQRGMLEYDEIPMARKVLSAAALTYVAALVSTLLTILRFALIIMNASGKGRRR